MFRGIKVDKIVQIADSTTGKATSGPVTVVPAKAFVKITLRITTVDDLERVRVVDRLPGGLEPLDPATDSLAAESQNTCDTSVYRGSNSYACVKRGRERNGDSGIYKSCEPKRHTHIYIYIYR